MQNRHEAKLPRLAQYAARHPRLYRARVLALAALAYGLILGLVFFLIALEVVLVVVMFNMGEFQFLKLIIPLLLFIGILVSALQIDIPPPKGIAVTRAEAPALWAEIDRVRKAMRGPAPHQLLIDGEFNASVAQVPRLGVLGFYRTYLTIGLPLAACLTPDELRAVLAHEYGHVSGKHGRLGVWIYRVQATWAAVLEDLQHERHWTAGLFRGFLRWYAPYFEAYTAVLRRAHEFDADREAARVAGAGVAAAALCRVETAAAYLASAFWPEVFAKVPEGPTAPAGVYRRLLAEGHGAARHADAERWLRDAAARRTEPWDTHPSLSERLASLGATPALPAGPARPSAAAAFLGTKAESLADRLSRKWADTAQFSWRRKHNEHLQRSERLTALEARAGTGPLPAQEVRERILLTVQVHGETVAMPLMRDFVAAGGDDATVHFLLGHTLLARGDAAGLPHLERAMEMDIDAVPRCCALAAEFLKNAGRAPEAGAFRRRSESHTAALERAAAERDPDKVTAGDRFLPHGLGDEHARALAAGLARVGGVKRALLVRKQVAALPQRPAFVLAIEVQRMRYPGQDADHWNQTAQIAAAGMTVPGTLTVIRLTRGGLERALGKVPGAELYRRAAPARV